jgi:hypothetical protein
VNSTRRASPNGAAGQFCGSVNRDGTDRFDDPEFGLPGRVEKCQKSPQQATENPVRIGLSGARFARFIEPAA